MHTFKPDKRQHQWLFIPGSLGEVSFWFSAEGLLGR